MATDVMLQEAIEAIRQGQRLRARDLLTRLLRADQNNPTYWLWMSSVVDTVKEQAYCLQTVLRLDPSNASAKKGLVLIGAMPSDENIVPAAIPRRRWQVALQPEAQDRPKGLLHNPWLRLLVIGGAALIVIGLIAMGVYSLNRQPAVALLPTRTPGPPPTFTSTPTEIPATRVIAQITPSPTFSGPTPLWMLLEATYTPTPLYVTTPHPIAEAYRVGQRLFLRGDWSGAQAQFSQAAQVEPDSADIPYYIGETQRMLGDTEAALEAYNRSLDVGPNFAPAYLGRARARLALDPQADVAEDLDQAIQLDPNLGEAYLERAALRLRSDDIEAALEDLDSAAELLPESPLLSLQRAQAAFNSGDYPAALEMARQAYQRDRTLLPAYRILGLALLANGEAEAALEPLEIYTTYDDNDPRGWLAYGQVKAGLLSQEQVTGDLPKDLSAEDMEAANQAFVRALELDPLLVEAHFYQALALLAQGEGQAAVNSFFQVRRVQPGSFLVNFGIARALLVANRLNESYEQFNAAEHLAEGDEQLAALYHWRARTAQSLDSRNAELVDLQALLELPEESVPSAWRTAAQLRVRALTATSTPTVTHTTRPSATPSGTPTPTRTPTRTRLATRTPTRTPRVTATP